MATRLDDNTLLQQLEGREFVVCAHCNYRIAEAGQNYFERLACYEGPPSDAGPQIWKDASTYIDKPVLFRQYCCPGCYTAFRTEVVPVDHPLLFDRVLTNVG